MTTQDARTPGNAAAFDRARSQRVRFNEQEDPMLVIREVADRGLAVDHGPIA